MQLFEFDKPLEWHFCPTFNLEKDSPEDVLALHHALMEWPEEFPSDMRQEMQCIAWNEGHWIDALSIHNLQAEIAASIEVCQEPAALELRTQLSQYQIESEKMNADYRMFSAKMNQKEREEVSQASYTQRQHQLLSFITGYPERSKTVSMI